MKKPAVYLLGQDNADWAVDEDFNLTKTALQTAGIKLVDSHEEADIIHVVWWNPFFRQYQIDASPFFGKRIVCQMTNNPFTYLTNTEARHMMAIVGCWISQSTQAKEMLDSIKINNFFIPYGIDTKKFFPRPKNSNELSDFRTKWKIPSDKYIIGNFHRDTVINPSHPLHLQPKPHKGPEMFVEIITNLHKNGFPVHALLSGPRRHWIINKFEKNNIPYTFIGKFPQESTDDWPENIQPRSVLNDLYNIIDLYLITSRWEGGPHSVLESSASKCKVISTDVGIAQDVLPPDSIFTDPLQAIEIIKNDINEKSLEKNIEINYKKIIDYHTENNRAKMYTELYYHWEDIPVYEEKFSKKSPHKNRMSDQIVNKLTKKVLRLKNNIHSDDFVVSIWHDFRPPPWGGGNQFTLLLVKYLESKGVRVLKNQVGNYIDAYLLNSIHFDVEQFRKASNNNNAGIIHRIDGPIYLIRGKDKELDELCYALNAEFAYATVLQSNYVYRKIIEFGYSPVNPVIIQNTVDPEYFFPADTFPKHDNGKIKLIASAWSSGLIKGHETYKWIEEHLDWDKYEFTFVGNTPIKYQRINHIQPVDSKILGNLLREHDIYITASKNDPCSNALIEAQACGLPALFYNSGGHPEIVSHGGLPFNAREEILPNLDKIASNYDMFRNLIYVPSINEICEKYYQLLLEAATNSK
jgi:glycosyltransferase involved in cell wall biosynthesis